MRFIDAILSTSLAAAVVVAAPLCKRAPLFDGTTLGAWWGQATHDLSEVCANPSVDIVYLAFVTGLNPPSMNLGKSTGQPSAAQTAKGWTKLFDGTVTPIGGQSVADQIKGCQKRGKKVLVSFGGDLRFSTATFTSAAEAVAGADMLYDLFLGGSGQDPALRPFGKDVVFDGADLDNETGNGAFYPNFVGELRAKMASDPTGRKYILSGSAECGAVGATTSDATSSLPDSVIAQMDVLSVMFYDNPTTSVGEPGFPALVQQWSQKIAALNPATRFMVGSVGSPAAGFQLSMTPDTIAASVAGVKAMKLPNFAGFSVWDAGYAMDNPGFLEAIKKAL